MSMKLFYSIYILFTIALIDLRGPGAAAQTNKPAKKQVFCFYYNWYKPPLLMERTSIGRIGATEIRRDIPAETI